MNLYHKIKLLLLTTNVVGIIGLIFFFSWWGLAAAVATWIIFNYGISAGFHRLFAHRSYETNSFVWWALLISGTLASIGSSIAWIGQHRTHHRFSDVKEKDPYYPHDNWIYAWVFGPWATPISPLTIKDLLKDNRHKFFHDHYFKIIGAYIILLALINPVLVFWLWALPGALTFFSLQVTGVLGHMVGYRDYDIDDESRNNHILNIFTFGESYQNTHHNDTTQIILGKYDLVGYTIKHVFAK